MADRTPGLDSTSGLLSDELLLHWSNEDWKRYYNSCIQDPAGIGSTTGEFLFYLSKIMMHIADNTPVDKKLLAIEYHLLQFYSTNSESKLKLFK